MTISSSNAVFAAMEALTNATAVSARDNEVALAVLATAAFLKAFGDMLSQMKTQADKEAFMQRYLDTHKSGTDESMHLTTQAQLSLDAVQNMLTKSKAYDAQIADLLTQVDQGTKQSADLKKQLESVKNDLNKGYTYWFNYYLSAGTDNTAIEVLIGIGSGGSAAAFAASAAGLKMSQLANQATSLGDQISSLGNTLASNSQKLAQIQTTQATLASNMATDMLTHSSALSGSANGVLSNSKAITNNAISFLEGIGRASSRI